MSFAVTRMAEGFRSSAPTLVVTEGPVAQLLKRGIIRAEALSYKKPEGGLDKKRREDLNTFRIQRWRHLRVNKKGRSAGACPGERYFGVERQTLKP